MSSGWPGPAITWVLGRLRGRAGSVVAFALAFKALDVVLLAPLAAGVLRLFLLHWGRASVGNFEIAQFALSPVGLAALVSVGTVGLATLYLELAGLMHLLGDRRTAWWQGLTGSIGLLPRLLQLGMCQLAVFVLLALPFMAVVWMVYRGLWGGRDIYGLLALKPPVFWAGVGLAALPVAAYAVLAFRLFLRWLCAVPAVLFEPGVGPLGALKLSDQRTKGRLTRLAVSVLAWFAADAAFSAVVLGLLKFLSEWILDRAGSRLAVALPATAALLALHALVVAGLAIVGSVSFAALVLALYAWADGPVDVEGQGPEDVPSTPSALARVTLRRTIIAGLVVLAALTVATGIGLIRTLSLEDRIEITAHRAGATHAPENTVAALRRAIADRADWAEIDVQRTADDALIVTHDTDLARIGGGSKAVWDATLAEVRALDVGSRFGAGFAGERVPTFDEFLAAAGDAIKLNVELKPHGPDDVGPLTSRVVEAITKAGLVGRCRICSQSYEALQISRRLEPRMAVGYIAGAVIGDVSQLDVDFLMVRTDLATRGLVDRAALRKTAVHAWTVNDPAWLPRLLDRGVANVITDDPGAMRARLKDLRALGTVDRLLLRVRDELID